MNRIFIALLILCTLSQLSFSGAPLNPPPEEELNQKLYLISIQNSLQPGFDHKHIVTGRAHTCAITPAGGVKCWGDNLEGQLGSGSYYQNSSRPVAVTGLQSGVVSLASGLEFTCALTWAGAVKCWGNDKFGQLGVGGSSGSPVPVDVLGLQSGVISIVATSKHACAVLDSGGVKCWGYNVSGGLGNGVRIDSPVPVNVLGLNARAVSVAAGTNHSCALTFRGEVFCWGTFSYQGNPSFNTLTPLEVTGISGGVGFISANAWQYDLCALAWTGELRCLGETPVPASFSQPGAGVKRVAVADSHTCVINAAGGVQCWGRNKYGQLGNGTVNDSSVPVQVIGLQADAREVYADDSHSCALTDQGRVKCWGANGFGQLGNGRISIDPVPAPVDVVDFP